MISSNIKFLIITSILLLIPARMDAQTASDSSSAANFHPAGKSFVADDTSTVRYSDIRASGSLSVFSINETASRENSLLTFREQLQQSEVKPEYDYYRFVERFRLYNTFRRQDPDRYQSDLMRQDQNWQHYENNLFDTRRQEFNHMMDDFQYFLKKRMLVGLNYLLTNNLSPANFPESSYLVLKSEDILITNNSLNLLHQVIGKQEAEAPLGTIALDIHVHTYHSFDGTSNLEKLLLTAYEKGFRAIAITDHDYFDGSGQALQITARLKKDGKLPEDFVVIPGMEISSREGHILGLFLKSYIPHGLTAEQTIQAIHAQEGLAVAPHPFQPDFGIGPKLVKTLDFDGMVVTGVGPEFRLASDLAEQVQDKMAVFMDSDTHVENGLSWMGYTLVNTNSISPEGIHAAIRAGQTQPVHQNIMKTQSRMVNSKIARNISRPVVELFRLRYQMEMQLATLLLADRVHMQGIVPDLMHDLTSMSLFNPLADDFFGSSLTTSQFIQGIEAYYGTLYLNLRRVDRNVDVQLGMKLAW